MNRREAIIAGMAAVTTAVAVAPKADASKLTSASRRRDGAQRRRTAGRGTIRGPSCGFRAPADRQRLWRSRKSGRLSL